MATSEIYFAQLDDGVYALREPDLVKPNDFSTIALIATRSDKTNGYVSEFIAHSNNVAKAAPMELVAPSLANPAQDVTRDITRVGSFAATVLPASSVQPMFAPPATPHAAMATLGVDPIALDAWHMESVYANSIPTVPTSAPTPVTGHERWWITDNGGNDIAAVVTWINRPAGGGATCAVAYLFSKKDESGNPLVKYPLNIEDPTTPRKIGSVDQLDPAAPWTVVAALADTAAKLEVSDLAVCVEKLIGLTHLGVGGLTAATPWGTFATMPADTCGDWRP